MTKLQAVLFDHDGTLVDSEGIHHGLWRRMLPSYGVDLQESEYKAYFVGVPTVQSAVGLVQRHGLTIAAHDLALQKETLTLAYLRERAFPLMHGATEAVEACRALGLRLGVVTGAGPDGIAATLRDYRWADKFETVVTAADVKHSKPAPDVYQLALSRLGLQAHEAVAIEDTSTGVRAARSAGLTCLAIPQAHSAQQDFSAASAVFSSLNDAMQWIRVRSQDSLVYHP